MELFHERYSNVLKKHVADNTGRHRGGYFLLFIFFTGRDEKLNIKSSRERSDCKRWVMRGLSFQIQATLN